MYNFQQKNVRHIIKQEIMALSLGKEGSKVIETVLEDAQALDLLEKDFKLTFLKCQKRLRATCSKNKRKPGEQCFTNGTTDSM